MTPGELRGLISKRYEFCSLQCRVLMQELTTYELSNYRQMTPQQVREKLSKLEQLVFKLFVLKHPALTLQQLVHVHGLVKFSCEVEKLYPKATRSRIVAFVTGRHLL